MKFFSKNIISKYANLTLKAMKTFTLWTAKCIGVLVVIIIVSGVFDTVFFDQTPRIMNKHKQIKDAKTLHVGQYRIIEFHKEGYVYGSPPRKAMVDSNGDIINTDGLEKSF